MTFKCGPDDAQDPESGPGGNEFPRIPSGATGKPYDWSLEADDRRPLLALSADAMAVRTDAETAARFKSAVERTAAFFVVVSRNNGYEGRNPAVITEDLTCGTVAGMLGLDIDMLAAVLVEMRDRGLIDAGSSGNLEIRDIDALDRLSDGL
jgi:CRP/FNR family transcriptional regulator, anaerobic regulatory protein